MDDQSSQDKLVAVISQLGMTEVEQAQFLAQMGEQIIESATGRLVLSLNEQQLGEIERQVEALGEEGDLLEFLAQHYPQFDEFLKEETVALREEMLKVVR